MNNAVSRQLYDEQTVKQLAPVIPIKPAKKVKEKITKAVSEKTGEQEKTVSSHAFSGPVFKPKKHDML